MANPDISDRGRLREAGQANAVTLTSTVAAGATPTKAEFDALRADLVAIQTSFRDAGIMA
jgi:hypothetical protein